MNFPHGWDLTPAGAAAVQLRLRSLIRQEELPRPPGTIAGSDVAYSRGTNTIIAAVVVLSLPSLDIVGRAIARQRVTFPYIPGLLSFRESPAILKAWEKLPFQPDVLMADGHGLAHPRGFGIACHLGLLLDVPAIGCAKEILTGTCDEPGREAGSTSPLGDDGRIIGMAVRTRSAVRCVYISVGHRITLRTATDLALQCASGRSRIPEPVRQAHIAAAEIRSHTG